MLATTSEMGGRLAEMNTLIRLLVQSFGPNSAQHQILASTPIGLAFLQGDVHNDISQVLHSHDNAVNDVDEGGTNAVQASEVGADIGVDTDEVAEPEVDYLMDHPPDNAADVDPKEIQADVATGTTSSIDGVALNPPAKLVDNPVMVASMDALPDPYSIEAQPESIEGEGTPIALARQSVPREVFLMLEGMRT